MPKRVLIVEDEIFVALEIEDVVRSAGFDVSMIATDLPSALAAADESDIALVDVNLRDGRTGPMIGRALADYHDVRVIYVTANPAQIDAATGCALGVIAKPFDAMTIREAVILAATNENDLLRAQIAGFTPFSRGRGSSRPSALRA